MRELMMKSFKVNIILVLTVALGVALMRNLSFSAGILIGAFWSMANFLFTINLLEMAILQKSKRKLLLLLLIKFPVLYLLGFLILLLNKFPVLSLLLGMSSILLVLGVFSIWSKRSKPSTNFQI